MITEIILAVNFQMRCSQMAIDRIEEDDSPGFKVIKNNEIYRKIMPCLYKQFYL